VTCAVSEQAHVMDLCPPLTQPFLSTLSLTDAGLPMDEEDINPFENTATLTEHGDLEGSVMNDYIDERGEAVSVVHGGEGGGGGSVMGSVR